jgi:hypothetical protein
MGKDHLALHWDYFSHNIPVLFALHILLAILSLALQVQSKDRRNKVTVSKAIFIV